MAELESSKNSPQVPLCPSSRPELPNSRIIGIVEGSQTHPRITHLKKAQPVTQVVLDRASPQAPTEVFRFAADCLTTGCKHFDGLKCKLVKRVIEFLPPASAALPICAIRGHCLWWQQEGKSACLRCSGLVSTVRNPSELIRRVSSVE